MFQIAATGVHWSVICHISTSIFSTFFFRFKYLFYLSFFFHSAHDKNINFVDLKKISIVLNSFLDILYDHYLLCYVSILIQFEVLSIIYNSRLNILGFPYFVPNGTQHLSQFLTRLHKKNFNQSHIIYGCF